jgi:hypothetical protein
MRSKSCKPDWRTPPNSRQRASDGGSSAHVSSVHQNDVAAFLGMNGLGPVSPRNRTIDAVSSSGPGTIWLGDDCIGEFEVDEGDVFKLTPVVDGRLRPDAVVGMGAVTYLLQVALKTPTALRPSGPGTIPATKATARPGWQPGRSRPTSPWWATSPPPISPSCPPGGRRRTARGSTSG